MSARVPGGERYRVTAALVVVRCAPRGGDKYVYRGGMVPGNADPRQVAHMLTLGLIVKEE